MAAGGGGGQPPGTPLMVRRLAVEVVDARDLAPKDGLGTSSAYAVVDFDGQRKRTRTVPRDLNPQWHERLEFVVPDPANMHAEALDVSIYHDRRFSPSSSGGGGSGKNHFLGRVRIYGSQFSRCGEEGIVYFPLEKRSLLSWIRGEVGLKTYYYDEPAGPAPPEDKPPEPADNAPPPEIPPEQPKDLPEMPAPTEAAVEVQQPQAQPPVIIVGEAPMHPTMMPPVHGPHGPMMPPVHGPHGPMTPPPPESHPEPEPAPEPDAGEPYPPEVRKTRMASSTERVFVARHPSGGLGPDYYASSPRVISGRFVSTGEAVESVQSSSYDLVEPMRYLFVRVVQVRGIRACEGPYVKVQAGPHSLRSRPGHDVSGTGNPEWNQVFAISHAKPEPTLEISVWDGGAPSPADAFLGGVCFDLSDVPVRDQPDGPLAPQWYRLEGGEPGIVTGDIMVAVWIGTQADEAFPEAWNTDVPYAAYTRSKVYQSPKLWYLRASVIEAQDLRVPAPPQGLPFDVRVKIQLGIQSARTRRSVASSSGSAFAWSEDLMFVASEPLDDSLIVFVEDRSMIKEPALLGHTTIPVSSVEQRLDERQIVASRWFNLEGRTSDIGMGSGKVGGPHSPTGFYSGRLHLRLCLEGGYHVLDEAAHVCSDYRPTAKQLWKPPVGVLELGIIGACGLLPMKTKGGAKGSTDAYCAAKYGKKWVRTRTVTDSLNPRWNEQYTWQVYDPCTVLTVAVFDNWRMFAGAGDERQDYRIGKVRVRVSTLESNRVYTASYPLLVLLRSGLKKMGEVQLAVRFSSPGQLPDTWATYTSPLLPRMHYLRPIGVAQQEALRGAAVRTVAAWLARSEPPLGPEVVRYMLDADAHTWSVRRAKANWFRIMGVLAWAVGLARWLDGVQRWRNPSTTVLVHVLYLVLVWYPELVVPTASLYVFIIGVWYYRFRPRAPAGMDARLSQADTVDGDELEEEFDPVPPPDVLRVRYERLRTLAGRVQRVMGDVAAQGERLQSLVSWRDPRASRIFVGVCFAVAVALYAMPPKMVAVASGFYYLRHPMFRDPMPPPAVNFFRRLPSLSDRML
ncbi:protein QUIRKY-like [Phragmites australis]|uniref:protein QUIRKY-like n=1 Tax=Phragmites australis TaxID=29695 RepID=UPI002D7665A8|nr:protein QUIRKY-like [Phragmites australis]